MCYVLQVIIEGLKKLREQEKIFSYKSMKCLGYSQKKTFMTFKKVHSQCKSLFCSFKKTFDIEELYIKILKNLNKS